MEIERDNSLNLMRKIMIIRPDNYMHVEGLDLLRLPSVGRWFRSKNDRVIWNYSNFC